MVPVQRKTRSQSRMGRAHKNLKPSRAVTCPNCSAWKLPHAACSECGYVRPGLSLKLGRDDD